MSARVDKILEILDDAGQSSQLETGYPEDGGELPDGLCWRCVRFETAEESDMCVGCRAFLLGDSDADPCAVAHANRERANAAAVERHEARDPDANDDTVDWSELIGQEYEVVASSGFPLHMQYPVMHAPRGQIRYITPPNLASLPPGNYQGRVADFVWSDEVAAVTLEATSQGLVVTGRMSERPPSEQYVPTSDATARALDTAMNYGRGGVTSDMLDALAYTIDGYRGRNRGTMPSFLGHLQRADSLVSIDAIDGQGNITYRYRPRNHTTSTATASSNGAEIAMFRGNTMVDQILAAQTYEDQERILRDSRALSRVAARRNGRVVERIAVSHSRGWGLRNRMVVRIWTYELVAAGYTCREAEQAMRSHMRNDIRIGHYATATENDSIERIGAVIGFDPEDRILPNGATLYVSHQTPGCAPVVQATTMQEAMEMNSMTGPRAAIFAAAAAYQLRHGVEITTFNHQLQNSCIYPIPVDAESEWLRRRVAIVAPQLREAEYVQRELMRTTQGALATSTRRVRLYRPNDIGHWARGIDSGTIITPTHLPELDERTIHEMRQLAARGVSIVAVNTRGREIAAYDVSDALLSGIGEAWASGIRIDTEITEEEAPRG